MSVPPLGDSCRVCGFDVGGGWADGSPLYAICPCCGAESGVDDHPTRLALGYLIEWVEAGTPWFDPSERPDGWNLRQQLHAAGRRRGLQRLDSHADGTHPGSGRKDVWFVTTPFWESRAREGG